MASPHIHYPQAGSYQGGQQSFRPATHVYPQSQHNPNQHPQAGSGLTIHTPGPRVGTSRGGYPAGPSRHGPGYQASFPPHHYHSPMFTPIDHGQHTQTPQYQHQPHIIPAGPVSMGHQNVAMPQPRFIRGNTSRPVYPHYYQPHAYPTTISTSAPSSSPRKQASPPRATHAPAVQAPLIDIKDSQLAVDVLPLEAPIRDSISDGFVLSPTGIEELRSNGHSQSKTNVFSTPERSSRVEPAILESQISFPDSCNFETGYALQSRRPRVSEAVAVTVSQAAHPHSLFYRLVTPLSKLDRDLSLEFRARNEEETSGVTCNKTQENDTPLKEPSKSSTSTATTEISTAPATPQLGSPQSSVTSLSIVNKSPVTTKLHLNNIPSQHGITEPQVSITDVLSSSSLPTQVTPSSPSVKKTWASLLKPSSDTSDANEQNVNGLPKSSVQGFSIPATSLDVSSVKVEPSTELLKLLTTSTLHVGELPNIRARGIINLGNMCFANTVLQVLMYSPAFHALFKELDRAFPDATLKSGFNSSTPLVYATIAFIKEFYAFTPSSNDVDDNEDHHDYEHEPFVPTYIYEALKEKRRFDSMRGGQQEDAEEFLGFYLDTLEEELISLIGIPLEPSKYVAENSTPSGWLEVGKKNKTVITRTHKAVESPISKIFGGKSRTSRRIPGARETVMVEPWSRLQLDIQPDNIRSIDDALRHVATPETVQVTSSSRPTSQVEAQQQTLIDTLPPVLVLHLKRFLYDTQVNDVVKLNKLICYGPELEIPREVLYSKKSRPPKYKLFGVLNHHGSSATGGHYTLDVLHPNPRKIGREGWVRIDDDNVQNIFEEDLAIKDTGEERSAYLLFYRRMPASGHS